MGGGFGGCTINLVKDGLYDNFIATAKEKFNAVRAGKFEVVISGMARAGWSTSKFHPKRGLYVGTMYSGKQDQWSA